ncbi:MAG: T9SS type A sorting domain-containing protein [Saprospiraceae bacterium]|nr:T9SS type A sorting domain-containing protein [Saprospiraceae bacterium]
MKYLLLVFILGNYIFTNGQSGFKLSYGLDPIESNASFQCIEYNNEYYFSGAYFDKNLGYWTVHFSKLDANGLITLLGTEIVDTIEISLYNKMVLDSNGIFILGKFRETLICHYNFIKDSIWVIKKINRRDNNFIASSFIILKDGDFIIPGRTGQDANGDGDFKIIRVNDTITHVYRDIDTTTLSGCSYPIVAPDGKIYLACFDFTNDYPTNDMVYIMCFDENLNKIFSGKDIGKMTTLSESKGFILDSRGHLLVTGHNRVPVGQKNYKVPQIAKFDKEGNLIWKVNSALENVHNYFGWGSWQSIIESHNKDGYILAGARYIGNESESQELSDAALAKIDVDGNPVWSKTYSFRDGANRVYCLLWDVVATSDGGYFSVGESLNASASSDMISDPPGFRSIILKTDAHGNYMPDTSSTTDITLGQQKVLQLYPNPSADYVVISHEFSTPIDIMIYNENGLLIDAYQVRSSGHQTIVDTFDWPAGNYFANSYSYGKLIDKIKFVVVH